MIVKETKGWELKLLCCIFCGRGHTLISQKKSSTVVLWVTIISALTISSALHQIQQNFIILLHTYNLLHHTFVSEVE